MRKRFFGHIEFGFIEFSGGLRWFHSGERIDTEIFGAKMLRKTPRFFARTVFVTLPLLS